VRWRLSDGVALAYLRLRRGRWRRWQWLGGMVTSHRGLEMRVEDIPEAELEELALLHGLLDGVF
jgi:hypothetical protein